MTGIPDRYHRSTLLFGAEGQRKLRSISVVVIGTGGLGSALTQQLALLGVKRITSIDYDELDETNRNRFIGARASDPAPGSPKVMLVSRMISEINPEVESVPLQQGLISEEAFSAVRQADWVFGCFDEDGPRAILNELCAAYDKPYIDLASDVPEPGAYGGRVFISINGDGCLECLDLLDRNAVRRFAETPAQRRQEDAIYGIDTGALEQKGPSVAPINGVIASLAATEFMVAVTGLRPPTRHLEYKGYLSVVTKRVDKPKPDCPCCTGIRGKPEHADVNRYLRIPHFRDRSDAPVTSPM